MPRYAGSLFDGQDIFGGEALAALQHLPDRRLGNATNLAKSGLRPSAEDCFLERFEHGGVFAHNRSYYYTPVRVKEENEVSRYYRSYKLRP